VLLSGESGSNGISLNNVVYFQLNSPSINGNDTPGTSGIVCDGTGNFTGTGYILNPVISHVEKGIVGTGSALANSMNAVTIIGGTIQTSVAGGIGLEIQSGNDNNIYGTDFESNTIAIKLGANARSTYADIRSESNTTDVEAIAGSVNNVAKVRTGIGVVVTTSDAGTNNNLGAFVSSQ
jgi:hypothetical protein